MGAGGDGGTGGGSFEGFPGYDPEVHLQDVREGYGSPHIVDNFEVLAQLDCDIRQAVAERLALLVSDAVKSHPSVDVTTEEYRAMEQITQELNVISTAVRAQNGSLHD